MTQRRRVRRRIPSSTIAVISLLMITAPCCTSFINHVASQSSSVVLSERQRKGKSQVTDVHFVRRKASVTSIQPREDMWEPVRERNVGRQFTSRHIKYEENRLQGGRIKQEFVPLKSDETKKPSRVEREVLTEKIAQLLNEDDDSFLATHDVADRQTVFTKLSDEEKSEAAFAVSKMTSRSPELEPTHTRLTKKGKVTANVLETGQDTMRQYVKSMGQHQVLSPEDESVLGRQIVILNSWEDKRQQLEETLLRYVYDLDQSFRNANSLIQLSPFPLLSAHLPLSNGPKQWKLLFQS